MDNPSSNNDLFESKQSSTIEAVIERVVFESEQTAWAVVRLTPEAGRQSEVTAVGPMYGVKPGERLRLTGRWQRDRKYGRQFEVSAFLSLKPSTIDGIKRYLGSGLIPGIGPVMAERLVGKFGVETLDIIAGNPNRLIEVEGIGRHRAAKIQHAWRQQEGIREILVFLQSHGISAAQATRIHRHYGADSIAAVRSNPYRLASEVFGFGFHTADQIASQLGVRSDSDSRVDAGVLYALDQAEKQGHTFVPEPELESRCADLLALSAEVIRKGIARLVDVGRIVSEQTGGPPRPAAIFGRRLFEAESGIAARINHFATQGDLVADFDLERELEDFQRREHLELAAAQRLALGQALTRRALILTGGPGTGKTTLIRGLVALQTKLQRSVLMAAPTGRAAKRLSEASGSPAKTIHRLLEFDPHNLRFQRHADRPLEADMVIIDEASMLDTQLANSLFQAIPDGSQLLLVGDADQLPSVGPGRVLVDLIASGSLPVVRLQEVYRQAARSLIIVNAHRIQRGQMPRLEQEPTSDFFFIERDDPEEVLNTLKHLTKERVPRHFGFDPRSQIQVLAPMRRGLVGTEQLNTELQAVLNPDGQDLDAGRGRFRCGDRVMQIRNNYDLEVFNGDIGQVAGLSADDEGLLVDYDGRSIEYPAANTDELVLAYACSIHKAQGSEYPCVIVPLHTQHTVMLQRNLLYTAITRGQRLVILIGQKKALALAVRNDRPQKRYTGLADRLRNR